MKFKTYIITLIVTIVGIVNATSQVVTTDPEFPTENDLVTIYFHADEGNQGLMDFDGDIYAHTGVITNLSASSSNWKYVIAEWSENTDKAKLTKILDNLYSLDIEPNIHDFYAVEENDTILKMAFVFRNADGSKTGRESDNGDVFVDVYEPGLNVNISSPVNDFIILPGEQISINASSNDADSMKLYIDDEFVTKQIGSSLTYTHTENNSGLHQIKVVAKNTEESVTDSVNYFVRGTIPEAEIPEGWIKGINYLDDDSVGLVLFAPNKEYVFVIGDFTDWALDENFMMNRTSDGEYYWLAISNLTPQQEYIFQYYIDGEIRIADPYTEKTSDINDKYISDDTYPGLIDYPESKTTNIASVLQTNQDEYVWENTDFTSPDKEDLIIYELLLRDFLAAHDYKTLIDTLDYLDSLGVNAIELMPPSEFEGNESWGYNSSFYFAPDKYYGPKNDFKAFVDECHGRNIAVIMDMVLNHSYGQSPLVRMYFDPNAGDYGQPTAENPWYNQTSPNSSYSWGSDFNHESVYTKEFVDSVNHYWLNEYKVDGFRFDFTKGFTNVSGDGWAYDASRIAILKRMADEIWNVNSGAYVILEHFTDNGEEKELSNYGMMIWGNINEEYRNASKGKESDISWGLYTERGWTNPYLVSYMESHDEQRLMYDNLINGNSFGSYDIQDLSTALKRIELVTNFFIPIPGPKMIWQFGELGYDISIDYDCRVCNKPIHWEYYSQEDRFRLFTIYKTLNELKVDYEVFKTDNYSLEQNGKTKSLVLNGTDMNVVIMGNFDVSSLFVDVHFPAVGEWYELYTGDTLMVNNVNQSIIFDPGEYRFYSDVKLKQPNLPTSIKDDIEIMGKALTYPNPTSDIIYFEVEQNIYQNAQIYLYDMNGRLKQQKEFNEQEAIQLNLSDFNTGIYYYKLIMDNDIYTGKVIKK